MILLLFSGHLSAEGILTGIFLVSMLVPHRKGDAVVEMDEYQAPAILLSRGWNQKFF